MRSKRLGSALGFRGLGSSIDCAWLVLDVSGCPGRECDAGRDRIYGILKFPKPVANGGGLTILSFHLVRSRSITVISASHASWQLLLT